MAQEKAQNALLKAGSECKLRLVRLLVEGGAPVNTRNEQQQTVLMLTCASKCLTTEKEKVVKYLLKMGALVNLQCIERKTALIYACAMNSQHEVIQAILDGSANVWVEDIYKKTAYDYAIACGNFQTLDLLIAHYTSDGMDSSNSNDEVFLDLPELRKKRRGWHHTKSHRELSYVRRSSSCDSTPSSPKGFTEKNTLNKQTKERFSHSKSEDLASNQKTKRGKWKLPKSSSSPEPYGYDYVDDIPSEESNPISPVVTNSRQATPTEILLQTSEGATEQDVAAFRFSPPEYEHPWSQAVDAVEDESELGETTIKTISTSSQDSTGNVESTRPALNNTNGALLLSIPCHQYNNRVDIAHNKAYTVPSSPQSEFISPSEKVKSAPPSPKFFHREHVKLLQPLVLPGTNQKQFSRPLSPKPDPLAFPATNQKQFRRSLSPKPDPLVFPEPNKKHITRPLTANSQVEILSRPLSPTKIRRETLQRQTEVVGSVDDDLHVRQPLHKQNHKTDLEATVQHQHNQLGLESCIRVRSLSDSLLPKRRHIPESVKTNDMPDCESTGKQPEKKEKEVKSVAGHQRLTDELAVRLSENLHINGITFPPLTCDTTKPQKTASAEGNIVKAKYKRHGRSLNIAKNLDASEQASLQFPKFLQHDNLRINEEDYIRKRANSFGEITSSDKSISNYHYEDNVAAKYGSYGRCFTYGEGNVCNKHDDGITRTPLKEKNVQTNNKNEEQILDNSIERLPSGYYAKQRAGIHEFDQGKEGNKMLLETQNLALDVQHADTSTETNHPLPYYHDKLRRYSGHLDEFHGAHAIIDNTLRHFENLPDLVTHNQRQSIHDVATFKKIRSPSPSLIHSRAVDASASSQEMRNDDIYSSRTSLLPPLHSRTNSTDSGVECISPLSPLSPRFSESETSYLNRLHNRRINMAHSSKSPQLFVTQPSVEDEE